MADSKEFLAGRLMVVAFEGWNDAGEAATGAVRMLKEQLDMAEVAEIDSEDFFDYQFNRPTIEFDDDGQRILVWPNATVYGPADGSLADGGVAEGGLADGGLGAGGLGAEDAASEHPLRPVEPVKPAQLVQPPRPEHPAQPVQPPQPAQPGESLAADAGFEVSSTNTSNVYLLIGTEPSRGWKRFTAEVLNVAVDSGVSGIVFLGAMLADVPHTRPISVYSTSENAGVRTELDLERSAYEGPVGILSVIADAAERLGVPTVTLWASVPHYVHNAPSPKATLALVDRLEELIDVVIPRGDLVDEAAAWESGIDALAGEDEEMATYIQQLEQARDTVDSPEASGEAIAQEFERYLRKRGDGPPPAGPSEPWRP